MERTNDINKEIKLRELIQSYCEVPEQGGDEAPGRWFLETGKIVAEIVALYKTGGSRRSTRKQKRRS
jgi:hypothetical protein